MDLNEALEIFCATENVDTPQPEDIDNFGGDTDESLFIHRYTETKGE